MAIYYGLGQRIKTFREQNTDILHLLLLFGLTRLAILSITIFTQQVLPFYVQTGEITGQVDLFSLNISQTLTNLGKGDVGWYNSILTNGYEKIPYEETRQHNWAFFPLWPLVWGLSTQFIDDKTLAGIFVANLLFLGGLINVYRICRHLALSQPLGMKVVLLMCLHPMGYFFAFPFTESLYLFLTSAFGYSFLKGHLIQSGAWGFLAALSRPNGILLIIFPVFIGLVDWGKKRCIGLRRGGSLILCALMTLGGLTTFMIYLHHITGNAFAFSDIQVTWSKKSIFFLITLWDYLRRINLLVAYWDFRIANLVSFFLWLLSGFYLWWRSPTLGDKNFSRAMVLYSLLSLLLPANTGILSSLTRYSLVSFPLFIALALFLEKWPTLWTGTLIAFSLGLGAMLVIYSSGYVLAAS